MSHLVARRPAYGPRRRVNARLAVYFVKFSLGETASATNTYPQADLFGPTHGFSAQMGRQVVEDLNSPPLTALPDLGKIQSLCRSV